MATFRAELQDHLKTLNECLLALEKGPAEQDREKLLADLFRAAHSIKGGAQAVGLPDIKTIAHCLEDVLGALQEGRLPSSPDLLDVLFAATDALEAAMAAQVKGERAPSRKMGDLLARLAAAARGDFGPAPSQAAPEREGADSPRAGADETAPPEVSQPGPSPAPQPARAGGDETIRVDTAKLDALMSSTGELVVAQMRLEQRLGELRALQQRVDDWQRSWRQVRGNYSRLARRDGHGAEVAALLDFLRRYDRGFHGLADGVDGLLRQLGRDCRTLKLLSKELPDVARRTRMLPVANVFDMFPRMARDLARERGKQVDLVIEGAETEVDRHVLEALKDPVTHLVRNAVDHGIEPPEKRQRAGKPPRGTVRLRAAHQGNNVVLEVADDGAGIDLEGVRRAALKAGALSAEEAADLDQARAVDLIFRPGLSTYSEPTDISGRGVGLDVVRQNVERLHGSIRVETASGRGTAFTLTLPLTLATSHVLLAETAGETVALPTAAVQRILRVEAAQVRSVEGKPVIQVEGRPVPLLSLARVLELEGDERRPSADPKLLAVIVRVGDRRAAFRVDRLHGTQEVIVKGLGPQLRGVRNLSGVTVLGSGKVVVILNPSDLLGSARATPVRPEAFRPHVPPRRRVLVVDDSITTRALEKSILQSAGYEVLAAADGQEAWALVQSESLDAVVADSKMPNMDGFALTEKVKGEDRYRELPVVLVTSLETPADKARGLQAGADAYITKSTFDQRELLATLERLMGEGE